MSTLHTLCTLRTMSTLHTLRTISTLRTLRTLRTVRTLTYTNTADTHTARGLTLHVDDDVTTPTCASRLKAHTLPVRPSVSLSVIVGRPYLVSPSLQQKRPAAFMCVVIVGATTAGFICNVHLKQTQCAL